MREGGLLFERVVAGYGACDVLHGVSFVARPGEVTGLIGPNGSGKTTAIRVAARGLRPRAGEVRVDGRNPYALRQREAARLTAVVPQDLAPVFSYAVLDLVLMGRAPHRSVWGSGTAEDKAHARRAMAATGIAHLADRGLDELSAGERQRVLLAQALAQDATVLLLDEPTAHLDLRHVVEALTMVRSLAVEEGRTVLAVFHDLNLAASHCDRIVALRDGRVVACGEPEEVVSPAVILRLFDVEVEVVRGSNGRPAVIGATLPELRSERSERSEVRPVR